MTPASGVDGRSSTDASCLFLPRELGFGSGGGCEIIGQPTDWMYKSWAPGDYRFQVTYRTGGGRTDAPLGRTPFKGPGHPKKRPPHPGLGGPGGGADPPYLPPAGRAVHAHA